MASALISSNKQTVADIASAIIFLCAQSFPGVDRAIKAMTAKQPDLSHGTSWLRRQRCVARQKAKVKPCAMMNRLYALRLRAI
jgi:hypothetical protein